MEHRRQRNNQPAAVLNWPSGLGCAGSVTSVWPHGRLWILDSADVAKDSGWVVAGDRIEQAVSVFGYACGAGNGMSPDEGITCLHGSGGVADDHGEPAQGECTNLQRWPIGVS